MIRLVLSCSLALALAACGSLLPASSTAPAEPAPADDGTDATDGAWTTLPPSSEPASSSTAPATLASFAPAAARVSIASGQVVLLANATPCGKEADGNQLWLKVDGFAWKPNTVHTSDGPGTSYFMVGSGPDFNAYGAVPLSKVSIEVLAAGADRGRIRVAVEDQDGAAYRGEVDVAVCR